MILHAHEFGPPVLLGDELQSGKLRRPHAAGSEIADFS